MIGYFIKKELDAKYHNWSSAFFWVLVHPLLLLAIYHFVFGTLFKARIPELADNAFIAYLALGLWPWFAFSDALMSASSAVVNKKELLGKVEFNVMLPVLAAVLVAFSLHMLGYMGVLSYLTIDNPALIIGNWLHLLLPLLILFMLALGLGLIVATLQVFAEDTAKAVNSLMTVLFFSVPIIYSAQIVPEKYISFMRYNPLFGPIDGIHQAMLFDRAPDQSLLLYSGGVAAALCIIGWMLFKRLSEHFEDYL